MEYLGLLIAIICSLAACSVALGFLLSDAGMVSLAQASFIAVGAYTWAVLVIRYRVSTTLALLCAGIMGLLVGLLASVFLRRLDSDGFVLGTLAIQLGFTSLLRNWRAVTNGNLGISLAAYSPISSGREAGMLSSSILLLGLLVLLLSLYRSSFQATVLHAIRDDRLLAESLGVDSRKWKAILLAICGAVSALAGVFYAKVIGFLHPDAFALDLSLLLLTIVVVASSWGSFGVVLSAAFIIAMPEALRFLPIDAALQANLRQVIYNLLLVVALSWGYLRTERRRQNRD